MHPATGVFLAVGFEPVFSGMVAVGLVQVAGGAVAAVEAEENERCDYEEDGGEDGDGDYNACAQFLDEMIVVGVGGRGGGGRTGGGGR